MAAAIGVGSFVDAGADHHVEPVVDQPRDHRGCAFRIIGRVPIGHDIDVGVHVSEHPAHDIALALHPLGADDRPCPARHLYGAVGAVVVEHVDDGIGERRAEPRHGLRNGGFFIIAGQQYGDSGAHGASLRT